MAEIKLFNEWLETHEISPPAIALWHGLMFVAWQSGWKPELNLSVSKLTFLTKLSRSAFYRERESLRQHGLIEFDSNSGSQSATYRIICFGERFASHIGTQTGGQPEFASHIGTQTEEQPEFASHIGTQTEEQPEFASHIGTQTEEQPEFASHIGTQTEEPPEFASHIGTQTEEQPVFASHIGTQTEEPPEFAYHIGTQTEEQPVFVSHIGTQNYARVPSEADFANGKIEKSPIYINNNKDIDKGGCGGKKKNADSKSKSPKKKKPEFDLSFIGDVTWEALVSSWLEYKRSRNESYKSDMSVKKFHTMLRNLSRGDPATARRIIDKSIANNWAGIFELSENDSRPRGQPATGQRIGQIKQPEDEERRRKLLEKFGGSGNDGKNKT